MTKDYFRWEPEMVEKMTTDEIEAKMKALVPGFDLGEFAVKTERYVSCEDLTDEEYYFQATFSDVDEDFIWIACEELWKRLPPDRPAIEPMADLVDDNMEAMAAAEEKGKVHKKRRVLRMHCWDSWAPISVDCSNANWSILTSLT